MAFSNHSDQHKRTVTEQLPGTFGGKKRSVRMFFKRLLNVFYTISVM